MTKTIALALAAAHMFAGIAPGVYLTKDAPTDKEVAEAALKKLNEELGSVTTLLKTQKDAIDKQYTELNNHFGGLKTESEDTKKLVQEKAAEYGEMVTKMQTLTQAVDDIKKHMDTPLLRGGKDLKDSDTEAAIALQKSAFLYKGGDENEFVPDMDKLVDPVHYRAACQKLMRGGIDSKESIVKSLSEAQRKAFEASSLDSAMFSPQMLGIEVDCNIECAELLDLYQPVTVSKTKFMYPQIMDYGAIGSYQCDAKCDAELGPPGNIEWKNGNTHDFRGAFCFQRKTLTEANYDLLGFMIRSAMRSHRINRNRALISGDGINEPQGWMNARCFDKVRTGERTFNHQDWRLFIAGAPVEYGPVVATMHQNMFAYLAAQVDNNKRFIFGDGLMTFSPDDVRERIRISNCLPDATDGLTKGSSEAPFDAGDFIAAAGNWKTAVAVVSKRPMFMEQYIGGNTAWCVMYQFGAEDGGFTMCCKAVREFVVGQGT